MTQATDLRRQAGQLLIMGFDGVEGTHSFRGILSSIQPGGVILFARNILNARQTYELLRACREAVETPLFTCVDMEGGTVDRLKAIIAPTLSAAAVAATGDRKTFRKHGQLIGQEVRALGFNTDFAPVFDLGFAASKPVLGSRAVSENPKATVTYAREFLRGLKSAKVLGCGKHFPGLGEGKLDSHFELPSIAKPWKRMWAEDLYPYRALHRDLPFVMVAHAAYPQVSGDGLPASLSPKWIQDVLRRKIGYRGLVICDDLEMQAVLAAGSIEHAAVETLRAGADIYLVCRNEEHVWRAYQAVVREAERDRKFAAHVEQAAARILRLKKRAAELRGQVPAPSDSSIGRLREGMQRFSQQIEKAKAAHQ